ncbi:hypothetical protein BH11ACT8_BH11ACT8_12870 [soil metagenome]
MRTVSRGRLRLVVAATVVLLLGLVITLRVLDGDSTSEVASSTPTEEVATKELATRLEQLLSYTPATVRSDLDAESAYLTGDFKSAFDTLVRKKIAPTATKFKISTTAEVVETGVIEAAPDQVVALVFVNVTTDSTQLPEPRLSGSRLKITLDRVDGDWLISEFDPV